ncbi:MAG: adenylate kinase [Fimbriimonadales bacterium]|nr:adenylate kinase [Fimbriimonadales bacterium]
MPVRRLVMVGPPGVGKGTQAKLISLRRRLPILATGDMLRSAVADKSDLGSKAADYMSRGELVPDDVIIEVVAERLKSTELSSGFLLDGFPRTVPQAQALDKKLSEAGLALDAVLALAAAPSVVIERIAGRLICPNCKSVYHESANPPREAGLCDVCSTPLIVREDDQPEAVRKRLEVYEESTAPLLEYYRSRGIVMEIDATGDVETVYARIEEALGK